MNLKTTMRKMTMFPRRIRRGKTLRKNGRKWVKWRKWIRSLLEQLSCCMISKVSDVGSVGGVKLKLRTRVVVSEYKTFNHEV